MPVNITESDVYPTTLSSPVSSEPASAPDLLSAFLQGAANRMNWTNRRLRGLGTAPDTITPVNALTAVQVPAASDLPAPNVFTRIAQALADQVYWLRRRTPGANNEAHFLPAVWTPLPTAQFTAQIDGTPSLGGGRVSFVQSTGSGYIYFPLQLPPVGTISSIWMFATGAGNAATPPTPPRLELVSMGDGAANPTVLATATDSTSYPAYDVAHLTFTSLSIPIPPNSTFGYPNSTTLFLRLIGQGGGAGVYQLFSLGVGVTA
jgi:hypothetical protein